MKHKRFSFPLPLQLEQLLLYVRSLRFWKTLLAMAVGINLFSLGINALALPQALFAGGITGIAMVIHSLMQDWGIGLLYLLLNVPLFVLGWRGLTLKYLFLSVIGMVMMSVSFQLSAHLHFLIEDRLMATVTAGVITGIGSGLYFRYGGSAGGLDILAAWFRKKYAIPLGTTFNLFNLSVLFCAFYLYDFETGFYSALFIFVNAWMLQKVISGFNQRSAVMIVTERPEEVADQIVRQLGRSFTYLQGIGGYSGKETRVIYTVINMTEAGRLKEIVYREDDQAFITQLNTDVVIGRRFRNWEDEGF